jgi:hypothetical protein
MGLLSLLLWRAAIACAVLRDNSRFGAFNSRLRGNEFPFSRRRELPGKGLICFTLVGAETALFAADRENSRFYGNNREVRARRNEVDPNRS